MEEKQIFIPNPCSENWNNMTATEQGRFCSQCEKTVIDFSTKSDTEIVAFFKQKQTKICGRFAPQQLQRNLHIVEQQNQLFAQRAAAVLLAGALSAIPSEMQAQTDIYGKSVLKNKGNTEKMVEAKNLENPVAINKDKHISIKGKINDESNTVGLSNARIILKGTNIGTMSDLEGNFNLNIPISFLQKVEEKNITLSFSYVGFHTKDESFAIANNKGNLALNIPSPLNIKLQETYMLTGEVVMIKKRTWKDRVHDFFLPRRTSIVYKDEI